jgi:hypothetical protein
MDIREAAYEHAIYRGCSESQAARFVEFLMTMPGAASTTTGVFYRMWERMNGGFGH